MRKGAPAEERRHRAKFGGAPNAVAGGVRSAKRRAVGYEAAIRRAFIEGATGTGTTQPTFRDHGNPGQDPPTPLPDPPPVPVPPGPTEPPEPHVPPVEEAPEEPPRPIGPPLPGNPNPQPDIPPLPDPGPVPPAPRPPAK